MDVLIVEDEKRAANRLEKLILEVRPSTTILDKIDSVKNGIKWFDTHKMPDLVFMDIQLADGLSFEILDQVEISAPIIFTTAYDEYALQAFKVNSIDYLLKPYDAEDLSKAFEKLEKLQSVGKPVNAMQQISQAMSMLTNSYKSRFMIKIGEHIKSISVDEIDYFFSRDKASYLQNSEGKNFILDYSLEEIETFIDPSKFFRINRKYIIALAAIKDIVSYSNSRLKIVFRHPVEDEVIVSRDRVADFKAWLDK